MATNNDTRRPLSQLTLFGDADVQPETIDAAPATPPPFALPADEDAAARAFATDPSQNVVLEASAGTGKTSVLVARYVNLLRAGVEPANILAITFTRKAAAEMRERIVRELRDAAGRSEIDRARWQQLRDRLGEIAISTIDAFCLSLLREFPLEADVDPGFDMADETEVPRLIEEALDQSVRIFTGLAKREPDVALVLAQLGIPRTREGLAALLERRLVAWSALDRFLARGPSELTAEVVCRRGATALYDVLRTVPGGIDRFLDEGPVRHPRYQMLVRELRSFPHLEEAPDAAVRTVLDRVASHFLTNEGKPRTGTIFPYKAEHYPGTDAGRRHRAAVAQIAPHVQRVIAAFNRDLNVVLARGVRRMFAIALAQYRRALEERSVLDFSDVLERALDLLRQMDEFAQSRFRLESRYHHVLVDEFQDTSRAQWELVALLVQSWGEGLGLATQPSIFIVGDRKQSIYRFRDAEVAVLQQAARHIEALRPAGNPRRSIARSFRAVPTLLAFVNDAFSEMSQPGARPDDFTYRDEDRFPIDPATDTFRGSVLGLAVADEPGPCAAAVAAEIARILREETVHDRATGVRRAATPGDIAILFRSRASHRDFERELELRGIPTYVYKGLGFFDADETKDLVALMRYLARPISDLRAAAFLRSRFVRLSDRALSRLAPGLADALLAPDFPASATTLDEEDRGVLMHARAQVAIWLARVDRVPPADLIEEILVESAYAYELRGPRRLQAWENLKKMRGLIRRIQNRGYATLPRIADHLDSLTAGDESNAVLEALQAVNLMTVHAAKGLEFPIVFVVNLAKGASGPPKPMRVTVDGNDEPSVSIGPFVSDVDEADRDREKHETRRLLYVAFTRARDRLYLATVLKDGAFAPGRGSLGEVLPESLRRLFEHAATSFDACSTVAWTGTSGRVFDFRLCPVPSPESVVVPLTRAPAADAEDGIAPAEQYHGTERRAVTTASGTALPSPSPRDEPRHRTAGRLIHRLFEADRRLDGCTPAIARSVALGLLTDEERGELENIDALVDEALDAWRRLRQRDDVASVLSSGERYHEVPFSLSRSGDATKVILRGTIDCLVRQPDGTLLVVEFKTGGARPEHEQQLAIYVEAIRALYPSTPVEGRLIYP